MSIIHFKLKLHTGPHFSSQALGGMGEQVGFWLPKYREKSEIIYSELLPTGQIIEEGIGNQKISEESDTDFENDYEKEDNERKHLNHSAKLLRSIITDKSTQYQGHQSKTISLKTMLLFLTYFTICSHVTKRW